MAHRFLRRHVALPGDHGSWVFLLSPFLIGVFAGGRWTVPAAYLLVASLCGFLARQPITIVVRILSGRRGREDLGAATFWIAVYAALGGIHVVGLVLRGFDDVLWLAIPAVPVFAWFLWLVSRKAERRQTLLDIVASGALALAAPAAYWIGVGRPDGTGWLLWVLSWTQSAASILHAVLRLDQRALGRAPVPAERWRMARGAVGLTTANVTGTIGLGVLGVVSPWLFVAYALQWLETLWGARHPAIGLKPRTIGLRQLAVSTLFTLVFIVIWTATD